MVTVYDVEQGRLVAKVAEKLKADKNCKIPEWVYHVKSGSGRVRVPEDPEWWYMRLASVLRQVYRHPMVGVLKLRTYYGGRVNRGHAPEKRRDAGGKIIRTCLQQLVALDLLKSGEKKGRVVSPKGQALLDNTACELVPKEKRVHVVKKAVKSKAVKPKTDVKVAKDTVKSAVKDTVKSEPVESKSGAENSKKDSAKAQDKGVKTKS